MIHEADLTNLKVLRPVAKEKAALQELYQRLAPFIPFFEFMAQAGKNNPKLLHGHVTLPQTNIALPILDAVKLCDFMQQVEKIVSKS